MVVGSALIKLKIALFSSSQKQHFTELHHVIGITGFRPLSILYHGGEIVVIMKVLSHAVATNANTAMLTHRIPEKLRGIGPDLIVIQLSYS